MKLFEATRKFRIPAEGSKATQRSGPRSHDGHGLGQSNDDTIHDWLGSIPPRATSHPPQELKSSAKT